MQRRLRRLGAYGVGLMVVALAPSAPILAGTATAPTPSASSCPWVNSGATPRERAAQVLARLESEAEPVRLGQEFSLLTTQNLDGYENETLPIPSLCIPSYVLNDGPAGITAGASGSKTQLPAPIALAAAFSRTSAHAYGRVLGSETSAKGIAVVQAPALDIVRVPLFGRAGEELGEDPYLAGELGIDEIRGIKSGGADSLVKHFVAYNQETHRMTAADDVVVRDRVLHEIYLAPFESAVTRAHPVGVMCAYPRVNGRFACESPSLLRRVLRDEWGFRGFVRSDLSAVQDLPAAFGAGIDLVKPMDESAFLDDVENGAIAQKRVDDAAGDVLTAMFRDGVFNRSSAGDAATDASTPAHAHTARQVAERGSVLLVDHGLLPLPARGVGSIAVIGAGRSELMGSAAVDATAVTPLEGIQGAVGPGVTVTFDPGTDPAAAAAAAAAARVAVVVVSQTAGEGHDTPSLVLENDQDALIDAVARANPRTVVVVNSVNPVLMPWLRRVGAVLEMWYPGEQDGAALASILFGRTDPSGKLPITFPRSRSATPVATPAQFPGTNGRVRYSEGLDVGYRGYQALGIAPLFPFGYGLSYTHFRFSHLRISRRAAGPQAVVHATITNTGRRAGADVAQLYIGYPQAAEEPPEQLKGFTRVFLEPKRAKAVSFRLTSRSFRRWSIVKQSWVVTPGRYRIRVGDSSVALPLAATIRIGRATPFRRRNRD